MVCVDKTRLTPAITRAADLVQDGQRIENVAWRNWAQSRSSGPTFSHALGSLLDNGSFKDWLKIAKREKSPPEPAKFYVKTSPRRNVSLSTMRGKFQAEKRRMAEVLKDSDDDWSDESVVLPSKSKERQKEEEAREMFAKQQIFGNSTPGLLSGMFKGGSMVDLVSVHKTELTPDFNPPSSKHHSQ